MSQSYDFIIGRDTPRDSVNVERVHSQILKEPLITKTLEGVSESGKTLRITFDVALPTGEENALKKVVGSHLDLEFIASTMIVTSKTTIPSASYSVLGLTFSNPSFFRIPIHQLRGRLIGQFKTNGTGCMLKVVEVNSGPNVAMLTHTLPDTLGVWTTLKENLGAPTRKSGLLYRLEGKLGAGATADVRGMAMAILHKLKPKG